MTQLVMHVDAAKSQVGINNACWAVGIAPATYYRNRAPRKPTEVDEPRGCRVPGRALSQVEREHIISILNSERFKDMPPPQIYSILLDEGTYLCSIPTMYRILHSRGEVKERRKQQTHVPAQRPELLATGPNQVWSWDITKLKGPRKWTYFHLYVVIDVFSRYVVRWCICQRSTSKVAEALLHDAIVSQNIKPDKLTIHSDNGGEMTSITVAELLSDLGVAKSHSRPHTSNDNPFSESHFKTMKYRPEIPARFESEGHARAVFRLLFQWYNFQHRHSGIAMHTPANVHLGKVAKVTEVRTKVLAEAHNAHPQRFVNKYPEPPLLQNEVWINQPQDRTAVINAPNAQSKRRPDNLENITVGSRGALKRPAPTRGRRPQYAIERAVHRRAASKQLTRRWNGKGTERHKLTVNAYTLSQRRTAV